MAFYLVKEKKFHLSSEGDVNGDSCSRSFIVPVSIKPAAEDGALNEMDVALLKNFINNVDYSKCPSGESKMGLNEHDDKQYNHLKRNLHVTIAMITSLGNNRDFVRVIEAERDGIFGRLTTFLEKHELKLKIAIEIQKFTCKQLANLNASQTVENVVSMETNIEKISSSSGSPLRFSGHWSRVSWSPIQSRVYNGNITIRCFLHPAVCSLTTMLFQKKPTVSEKILKEELNCDITITAGDTTINCHKSFLSAQSKVFQAMFRGENYLESKTNAIEFPDMTDGGVNALLAYLYLSDYDIANQDCSIAVELLQAGHKYEIIPLEESMKLILLTKPDNWYQADAVMKLFLFTKNFDEESSIKLRTNKLLKKYFSAVKTSPTYEQLLKDHPDAAVELQNYVFSI